MNGFKAIENEDGDVVLTKKYYKELLDSQRMLQALEAAGVDNWEGISYAHELYDEE